MKQTVRTDDGVDIEYEVYGLGQRTLFFQHGWSSRRSPICWRAARMASSTRSNCPAAASSMKVLTQDATVGCGK